MKKLLASALLAGLFLGTATPVFAIDGTQIDGIDIPAGTVGASTPVESSIVATYSVTIPSKMTIDLMSEGATKSVTDTVILTKLTAAGQVNVTAEATDLTLDDELKTGDNATLISTLATAVGVQDSEKKVSFSLKNDVSDVINTKNDITIATTDLTKDNLPGAYIGTIDFTFDYSED